MPPDTPEDIVTLIRSVSIFGPLLVGVGLLFLREPTRAQLAGIFLAALWCFTTLALLNAVIIMWGGWDFRVMGGTLWYAPLDLVIGWTLLWSVIPVLAGPRLHPVVWLVILFVVDIVVMPLLTPVLVLSAQWMWWDLLCLGVAAAPALYLARWTTATTHLRARSVLQVILFSLVFVIFLPALVLEQTHEIHLLLIPAFMPTSSVWPAGLAFCALPGVSAVQEFVVRGGGTPFPSDPPQRLVTTGPYAYLANPMQAAQIGLFFCFAAMFDSGWLLFAALVTLAYAVGVARWSEGQVMNARYGEAWATYRRHVHYFLPRWKPYRAAAAIVYFDIEGCSPCRSAADALRRLRPVHLDIVDARTHPDSDLTRLSYRDADGYETDGLAAYARALEHVNLFWAALAWSLRLPGVRHVGQIVIDVAFPPHPVSRETT